MRHVASDNATCDTDNATCDKRYNILSNKALLVAAKMVLSVLNYRVLLPLHCVVQLPSFVHHQAMFVLGYASHKAWIVQQTH